MTSRTPLLITIPISHYCEKARWALERAGVEYVEEGHVPLFHMLATVRRGGRTTPMLVLADRVLVDSTEILKWVDAQTPASQRLTPTEPALAAEVSAWEDELGRKLGPAARRIAYCHLLDLPLAQRMLTERAPTWERALGNPVFPVIRRMMRRGLRIDAEHVTRDRAKVDALFAKVEETLADGRRYLVGDRFTAADLTLAALARPLILPEAGPDLDRLAGLLKTPLFGEAASYRRTVAGQYVTRMYFEERSRRIERST